MSNQIGHAPVRLEATTTESRQVRASVTSYLIRPTEIQNSLGLKTQQQTERVRAKKARYRSSGTMAGQFQPKSGIHSFGWKPRARQRFRAGKTRICSSRTVAGQFQVKLGMHPFGWKPTAQQQFGAGRGTLPSSRTVAGQYQIRSGMHTPGWKPLQRSLDRSECQTRYI